jgi:hypothetical protein
MDEKLLRRVQALGAVSHFCHRDDREACPKNSLFLDIRCGGNRLSHMIIRTQFSHVYKDTHGVAMGT